MFALRLSILLLVASSAHAMEPNSGIFTWDHPETGTGLHISAKGKDRKGNEWTLREVQKEDCADYRTLFAEGSETFGTATQILEKIEDYIQTWIKRSADGHPYTRLTVLQNRKVVGAIQLGPSPWSGTGEISRAISSAARGNGLGASTLSFLVKDLALAIRKIGLGEDPTAPFAAREKFSCYGKNGEKGILEEVYASSRPSNVYSWSSYKDVGLVPFPPQEKSEVTYTNWEHSQDKDLSKQYKALEEYIIEKCFSFESFDKRKEDVFYPMRNLNGEPYTISYSSKYKGLRFHFKRKVE